MSESNAATETAVRVSTVELFFDLVFVFTVTQLTAVLADRTTLVGLIQVLIMFGITWWMYDGYAWLTNAVAPVNSLRRGLLVVGMAGFLTMALAIPHAFGSTGWAFGLGYFVVNLVHSGLFYLSGGPSAARAIRGVGVFNLLSASVVLAGGFAPTPWRYGLWIAAFALEITTPYLAPLGGFSVNPAYFVERHALIIIIALGESIVAIGVGASQLHLDIELIAVAAAGLIIAYFLYWANLGGDEGRAERSLDAVSDPSQRARIALYAYGHAHYLMLIGIIVFAAGLKKEIGHAFGHVSLAQAIALGGGVALFLAGDLIFRRVLGIDRPGYRLIALAGALVSIPFGLIVAALQLVVVMLALAVPLSVEGYHALRRRGVTTRDMFAR